MINKESIIEEFELRSVGSKGWMTSNKLICPNCGDVSEFNILFTETGALLRCLHSRSCNNFSMSLYGYLKHVDRLDLWSGDKVYQIKEKLEIPTKNSVELDLSLSNKLPPTKFKPIIFDLYLKKRGFTKEQYKIFNAGKSEESRLKNYIVFLMKFEGETKGWVARSKYSKEWHENNLKEHKENRSSLSLRYINSPNTDFSKMLLGVEEVTAKTEEIYLVEGLFDKANVDRQLKLYESNKIKCCCTFGNSISLEQKQLLKNTNIRNITLMYDYGTINKIKQYGMILSNEGFNVNVCEFTDKNIDAGDASKKYLSNLLSNTKGIYYFYKSRINLNLKI